MTNVTAEIKRQVHECVDSCLVSAREFYKDHHVLDKIQKPTIEFTLRGMTAGIAKGGSTVNLNPILLMENQESFIQDTVPHEVAHIICHQLWGTEWKGRKRIAHGNSWKRMMRILGADPSRCHTMDVTNAKIRRKPEYSYTCSKCQRVVTLGPTRHKRQQQRPIYSHCRGHQLDFVGKKAVKKLAVKPVVIPSVMTKPNDNTKPFDIDTDNKPMTKMTKARLLYANNSHLSRKEIIELFIASADCTPAGASTYYQTIKRTA